MVKRKIIKVGTSAAVILPKDILATAKVRIGDMVEVSIRKTGKRKKPSVRPEVMEWTERFIEEDRELLKHLQQS